MTKKRHSLIGFEVFVEIWNQTQARTTPDIHLKMASWLEECWDVDERRMLLMAFRESGKSTIAGLFAAWLIFENPDIRILVLAADHNLAIKMVRNVKRIIERHPLTEGLKPENADQWASDRFTVKRFTELRDPTMIAKGVISNITGSHADVVICDDVEVPNTSDSPAKREDLRERLGEIPYVLVKGGTQLYIGTPHNYFSIYADIARSEIGEETPFLDGFERLSLPILDEEGNSVWPEKYTKEDIEQNRISSGPNKFDSQMMLKPVNIMKGRLDPSLLCFYDDAVGYDKILDKLFIGSTEMAGATCWWDPAFGSADGDDSVCAIVYSDIGENYYLHHLEYVDVKRTDDLDEATQQARIVAKLAKEYYLPSITVEINGIGKFLPNMLRRELSKINALTRVQEHSSRKPKSQRILEAFDAVMASKRLMVNKSVTDTNFIMEMREWRPGGQGSGRKSPKGRDDALDAVAGALSRHPDRIKFDRSHNGFHSWQQGSSTHKDKGNWGV